MYNFNIDDMFALYLRKSQADDPNEPIEVTLLKHKQRLLETLRKYNISEKQIVIYEEVVSGDTIAERPQMKKLLNEVTNNSYRGVFVVAVDRFSRGDSIDQGIINNTFYFSNTLIITPEKIFDISNNEMDREQLEFGLFFSKREYNTIKKRLYSGRVEAAKQGYFTGSTTPYGYDKILSPEKKGYILIQNEEAKIVKKIFDMALEGTGVNNIAKYLNKIGIKPKRSKIWSPSMVSKILYRPVYYGVIQWGAQKTTKKMIDGRIVKKIEYNKNFDKYPGKHEPIITKDEFDEVHRIMSNKPFSKCPTNVTPVNSLAGIIYCGKCGKTMKRRPTWNKIKLICTTQNCDNVSSEYNLVENKLIESLNKILLDTKKYINDYEKECIVKNNSNSETIDYLDKQIEKCKKRLKKIQEFYELEDYTREEFLSRKQEINLELDKLTTEKNNLIEQDKGEKIKTLKKQIPKLEFCISNYYNLKDPIEKNKLLKTIVKKVTYVKNVKGRWYNDLKDKFELTIELTIDK